MSDSRKSYSDAIGHVDEAIQHLDAVAVLINTAGVGLSAAWSLRCGGPGGRPLDGAREDLVVVRDHLTKCREYQRQEDGSGRLRRGGRRRKGNVGYDLVDREDGAA
jgi:hypothetical protein